MVTFVHKGITYFRQHGPLGTVQCANAVLQDRMKRLPGGTQVCHSIDSLLCLVQRSLDRSFDRQWGTDTTGVIPLRDLSITSSNVVDGAWYEPASGKVVAQIMAYLPVDFRRFTFIDFGSGKGRILLLATAYGFARIIGVEFALELHQIALHNVEIWKRRHQPGNIEPLYMDAVEFPIPSDPLIAFFFSPFKHTTLEQVLANITTSYRQQPRPIALLFYGHRPDTLALFARTPFAGRELSVRPDWRRFYHYRSFLFTSAEVAGVSEHRSESSIKTLPSPHLLK